MNPNEQRRFPRVIHSFLIRYRMNTARGPVWRMTPLRDISSGGARFLCEAFFEVGKWIELQLVLPTAKEPIIVSARVVWSHPSKEILNLTEYGVAFELIDPVGRNRLEAALRPFLPP